MPRYTMRCRNSVCRHRRSSDIHPDAYRQVPRCKRCGMRKGWRIEERRDRTRACKCDGVTMCRGVWFPHKVTHKFCNEHPEGYRNQAKLMGVDLDETDT